MIFEKFKEHPSLVGETYFQHLTYAWKKSFCMLNLSLICFLHGLFPFIFKTTASDKIEEIRMEMSKRKEGEDGQKKCKAGGCRCACK